MKSVLPILITAVPVAATSSWLTAALQQEPVEQEPAAHEPSAEKPYHEMTEMEAMQKMMEFGMPGEAHAELAESTGTWNVTMKWRHGADQPWQESTGSSEVKMTLGGRYLVEQSAFNMMGSSYKGILFLGHDNLTETYQSVWMDSFGSRMTYSEGKEIEDGVIEFHGTMKDIASPEGRPFRMVTRHQDAGSFTLEMWDAIPDDPAAPAPDEPNVKVMEMEYARAE